MKMKSLRFSVGTLLAATLFATLASAQEQIPLLDDDIIPLPEESPIPALDGDKDPVPPPIWTLCGAPSKHLLVPDENGVTIEPAQPLVGENITVTVKGQLLKRVTAGKIDVDLRLMKFIKLTPQFDLCEQLEGDLFEESNASCPLEKGAVTLIAKKLIPEDVPKVSVQGNITLTNQDGEVLTCVHIDVILQSKDGSNRWGIF